MGFSVEYSGLLVSQLFDRSLFLLFAVRGLLCWALRSVGLCDEEENQAVVAAAVQPSSSSPAAAQPVSVEKIRESLPVIKYGAIAECTSSKTCAVCLSEFCKDDTIRELRICCHIFHKKCLDGWLDHDQRTCPLCRKPFLAPGGPWSEPSWAVERLLYLFGDDLLFS